MKTAEVGPHSLYEKVVKINVFINQRMKIKFKREVNDLQRPSWSAETGNVSLLPSLERIQNDNGFFGVQRRVGGVGGLPSEIPRS